MAHTHINCLLHVVFSTKNRAKLDRIFPLYAKP